MHVYILHDKLLRDFRWAIGRNKLMTSRRRRCRPPPQYLLPIPWSTHPSVHRHRISGILVGFWSILVCSLRMPLRSVIYFLLAGITHQSRRLSILLNSNKLPLISRPFLANVIKFLRLCVINSRPTATHPGTFISAHMYLSLTRSY